EAAGQSKTKVERRTSINIDGSGSTDGGMNFGARIRLRSDENDAASAASSSNVYMGNDMFRITVGNTAGAAVQRLSHFGNGNVGLTGLHWANVSYNIGTSAWTLNTYSSRGNAGDVVRLDINAGSFGVSLSSDSTGDYLSNDSEDGIAVSYNMGDWTVGAGYTDETDGSKVMGAMAKGSMGDFGLMINYTDKEDIGAKVVLAGSYAMGSTSLTGFIASSSEDTAGSAGLNAAGAQETEYGLGFSHSLGGASLKGGVSQNYTGETMADLGVSFGF
ncbi:MAG: porin, partial [Amylibacter sp.]|nr:porin [Amylibacter sp.]